MASKKRKSRKQPKQDHSTSGPASGDLHPNQAQSQSTQRQDAPAGESQKPHLFPHLFMCIVSAFVIELIALSPTLAFHSLAFIFHETLAVGFILWAAVSAGLVFSLHVRSYLRSNGLMRSEADWLFKWRGVG